MTDICRVDRRRCTFDEKGYLIQFPRVCGGWDFGRPLDVIYQEGRYYVVRRKGHEDWSGVGMRRYYSTVYMLLEVKAVASNGNAFILTILEREETQDRPWREIRRDMSAEAKRLNGNV